MKIIAATYVDHQEIVNYPLKQVLRGVAGFDDCYIFTSNESQRLMVKELLPEDRSIVIGHGIVTPTDIAMAENLALDWLFSNTDADFIVWVHADVLMSKATRQLCLEYAKEENLSAHLALNVWQTRMFCKMYTSIFGAVMIGRGNTDRFPITMDGGYLEGGQGHDESVSCYDTGHLDQQTMIRKNRNHSKVWAEPTWTNEPIVYTLLEDACNTCGVPMDKLYSRLVTEEDTELWGYILEMGLLDEYREVEATLKGYYVEENILTGL